MSRTQEASLKPWTIPRLQLPASLMDTDDSETTNFRHREYNILGRFNDRSGMAEI